MGRTGVGAADDLSGSSRHYAGSIGGLFGRSAGRTFVFRAKGTVFAEGLTVCLDYYYENDVPGMEAQNVAHMPVSLPYNSLLRGDVLLFSNGSPQEDSQVKAIADVLCGAD